MMVAEDDDDDMHDSGYFHGNEAQLRLNEKVPGVPRYSRAERVGKAAISHGRLLTWIGCRIMTYAAQLQSSQIQYKSEPWLVSDAVMREEFDFGVQSQKDCSQLSRLH